MNAHASPRVLTTLLLVGGAFATAWLAGCTKQESIREIDWAKTALARNPNFEIVATDEAAGVFTVRDTATGETRTLKLQELIAAPLPPKNAAKPAAPEPAPEVTPVESPQVPEDSGEPALAATQTTETVPAVPPGSGPSLAEGPGYSITRGTQDKPDRAAATMEGPGYKIERQQPARKRAPEGAVTASNAGAEKRSDPIICQGNRLMRIDGETLSFSGDAVIAEKGCDLYISNARINAGGVGIIARQARVHIVNSSIGGSRGSYEVSDGAEIYVASTTFTGVGRRFEGGSMTDLGGNSYESH